MASYNIFPRCVYARTVSLKEITRAGYARLLPASANMLLDARVADAPSSVVIRKTHAPPCHHDVVVVIDKAIKKRRVWRRVWLRACGRRVYLRDTTRPYRSGLANARWLIYINRTEIAPARCEHRSSAEIERAVRSRAATHPSCFSRVPSESQSAHVS